MKTKELAHADGDPELLNPPPTKPDGQSSKPGGDSTPRGNMFNSASRRAVEPDRIEATMAVAQPRPELGVGTR